MYDIKPYTSDKINEWNDLVQKSINGTFLHNRNYMDYHSSKFIDFSLMVYCEDGKLVAILPGNRENDVYFSHQGLTYGGLIAPKEITTVKILEILEEIYSFLKSHSIKSIYYKSIPEIYHKYPFQADLYSFFLKDAELARRDIYSVIEYNSLSIPGISSQRKRALKKSSRESFKIKESGNLEEYYSLLSELLMSRHNTKPVHSLKDLNLLFQRFPENIKLFTISEDNGSLLGGVIMYISDITVHAQYIAVSDTGRNKMALDILFNHLIDYFRKTHKYFSFGISNENNGRHLNIGLNKQKEGFGARSIIHDHYVLSLR